jgi:hypothetical protein
VQTAAPGLSLSSGRGRQAKRAHAARRIADFDDGAGAGGHATRHRRAGRQGGRRRGSSGNGAACATAAACSCARRGAACAAAAIGNRPGRGAACVARTDGCARYRFGRAACRRARVFGPRRRLDSAALRARAERRRARRSATGAALERTGRHGRHSLRTWRSRRAGGSRPFSDGPGSRRRDRPFARRPSVAPSPHRARRRPGFAVGRYARLQLGVGPTPRSPASPHLSLPELLDRGVRKKFGRCGALLPLFRLVGVRCHRRLAERAKPTA